MPTRSAVLNTCSMTEYCSQTSRIDQFDSTKHHEYFRELVWCGSGSNEHTLHLLLLIGRLRAANALFPPSVLQITPAIHT